VSGVEISGLAAAPVVTQLISSYGYWAVAVTIAFESMGVPLPGETVLVTAAVYAGTTHQLDIAWVIAMAIAGAIIGDNAGFLIGRRVGFPLLLRHGQWLHLTPPRIKLGRLLFLRHGGKIVFFGRFIALLRALAALLAGINCMSWRRFMFFNATGAVVWAGTYGMLAYELGEYMTRFTRPVAIAVLVLSAIAAIAFMVVVRRHEAALETEAERVFPGPLTSASLAKHA
jgi:membrane protein DedA with SNARE-associated domain